MLKYAAGVWVNNVMRQAGTGSQDDPAVNCENVAQQESTSSDLAYQIAINVLVFFTVWGISTVVDAQEFKKSFRQPAIYAGVSFQFLLMPLIGFITVLIFSTLDAQSAVALLILCASPGGSFSNWWCNLFNADLALSVSMTSLSTVASIGMLPLNILIYVQVAFTRVRNSDDASATDNADVDFVDLGITLGTVIVGISLGLFTGFKYPKHQNKFNFIGNVAGLASIFLGVFASTDTCDGRAPWEQPFFPLWIATATPLLAALAGVLLLGSLLRLKRPQRVAIALETAYQNTSIALAYTLGQGIQGREAAGVPVIYGGYEAGFFFIFMVSSWKLGWTFAPSNEKILRVMFDNWQPGSPNHRRLYPEEYDDDDLPGASGDVKDFKEEPQKIIDLEESKQKEKESDSSRDATSLDDEKKDEKADETPQYKVSV